MEYEYKTRWDKRFERYVDEKYKKQVKHKMMGINRWLTKSLRKILVEDKLSMKKR